MLTLGNLNTYTGATTISAGTLVTGAAGLGTGSVNVASGGDPLGQCGDQLRPVAHGPVGHLFLHALGCDGRRERRKQHREHLADRFSLASQLAGVQAFYSPQTLTLSTTAAALNYTGTTFPLPFGTNNKTFFDSYYSGMINITTSGTYTFGNNNSDDDVVVYIDGQLVLRGTPNGTNAWQGGYRQGQFRLRRNAQYRRRTITRALAAMRWTRRSAARAFPARSISARPARRKLLPDLVVGSLTGSGNVVLSTGNLSTGFDNTNTTFSGAISGIGGVNKWGTGTLTLAAAILTRALPRSLPAA